MNDSYDTRLCFTHTVYSSVMQTIHWNVGLKCFFQFYQNVFVIIVMYEYFIGISQGSVKTHLRCGGICNRLITLLQIVCRVCQ